MPGIMGLGAWRQEGHEFNVIFGWLSGELKARLDNMRTFLKTKIKHSLTCTANTPKRGKRKVLAYQFFSGKDESEF